MPKRPSANVTAKYVEFPPQVADALEALAARNSRTFRAELLHAVERHLQAPPLVTVTVITPEMPPACLPAPPRKTRGRRPK